MAAQDHVKVRQVSFLLLALHDLMRITLQKSSAVELNPGEDTGYLHVVQLAFWKARDDSSDLCTFEAQDYYTLSCEIAWCFLAFSNREEFKTPKWRNFAQGMMSELVTGSEEVWSLEVWGQGTLSRERRERKGEQE